VNRTRWMCGAILTAGIVAAVGIIAMSRHSTAAAPRTALDQTSLDTGMIAAPTMLRVPVSGIYPGGTPAGLKVDMANPLASDPTAVERGMHDFDAFNCSACRAPNGGGGMGPSSSNDNWIYRSSTANIYLSIAQGRCAGMPAFGAMLPDRTVWELVAYIQSIAEQPSGKFGVTTSLEPQSPAREQVPAGRMQTASPWQFTEPMPPKAAKPEDTKP
jgi:cytochrome c oxidase cbb3-type subunit 3